MTSPRLLTSQQYVDDAVREITRSRKRIYLLTMILNDDESTHELFKAIADAGRRGLDVYVMGDTFTYTELGGHFQLNKAYRQRIRSIANLRKQLASSGVNFKWLGGAASTLITSRTHTKWLVVDDIVYSFGGVNLYKKGVENVDYMFKTTDTLLASQLVTEQKRIIQADKTGHAYRSHTLGEPPNKVLVDGGFFGDSVIYRHACRLASQASKVTYVSQYCPTGKLARLLKKTESYLYFNPWNKANSLNSLTIRVGSFLSGLKTIYKRDSYLHCKFMLFDLPDGSQVAITGSHNFSNGGVWLGTREIALETRDQKVIKQLESFLEKYIV